MKRVKFYSCFIFTYYYGGGLFWFKILGLGLSFKNIFTYDFTTKKHEGWFFNKWLINFAK